MWEKIKDKLSTREKFTFTWIEKLTFDGYSSKLYCTCNENGKIVGRIEPTTLYFNCYYLEKQIGPFWKLDDAKQHLENKVKFRYGYLDE